MARDAQMDVLTAKEESEGLRFDGSLTKRLMFERLMFDVVGVGRDRPWPVSAIGSNHRLKGKKIILTTKSTKEITKGHE